MADPSERHGGHDPALVASLFDGDLDGSDLATAQMWVATCPSCASLHTDLLALSQATRAQPTPTRPRDYRLTTDDAARLRAEPSADDARLTNVMNHTPGATAHSTHDTTLVASLADHSLPATERAAGMDLVASCADCGALQADLVALVAATRAMPTPPRPIDYTLTRGHAARLRPNPWRRLVAVVGSAHDGVSRPLAMGFTALGLVGILVSSAPTILQPAFGDGSSAPSTEAVGASRPITDPAPAPGAVDTAGDASGGGAALASGAANAAASSGPERAPAFGAALPAQPGASGVPIADGTTKGAAGPVANAGPIATAPVDGATNDALTQSDTLAGVNALLVVSTAFVVVGLGLFLLRWGARRLSDG